MSETETQSIEITEAAARELRRILADDDQPEGSALRLFVQGGGCAGMSYGMKFEQEPQPGDRVFESEGVKIFMDPKSYLFLKGIRMDFKESLMGRGFVFENPNASGSCGCGTSFSV